MTLLELAERCEQASGPDRVLDAEIYIALREGLPQWEALTVSGEVAQHVAAVTASLDAAMTLVPEGYAAATVNWSPIGSGIAEVYVGNPGPMSGSEAATPALALCAAALRARLLAPPRQLCEGDE